MSGRATLDFLQAQATARRRTVLLVPLVLGAFAATVVIVHFGTLFATGYWFGKATGLFDRQVLWPVAGLVALAAVGGAGITLVPLVEGGGAALAELLGGVRALRQGADPAIVRLLNVVEEMAVAAGLPVPPVYVLPRDAGLNAFAAGFSADRSVIAVTRGALDQLGRDELQGVVAHELAHLLNGDVRLGTQLVAVVSGLASISVAGRWLLSAMPETPRPFRMRLGPAALGYALVVAGAVGAFFARLVQCAVSRQRELLADAAAVQLTRNPHGLASALRKIALAGAGVRSAHAADVAHLLFADAGGLFSTHPPIEERIRRLASDLEAAAPARGTSPVAPALERAAQLLAALPGPLARAARDPVSAPAVIAALLLDRAPAVRERQLRALQLPGAEEDVRRLAASLDLLPEDGRSAVLALALPGLAGLDAARSEALLRALARLAAADGRVSAFEWAVQRVVRRRIAPASRNAGRAPRHLDDVSVECLEVLSAVAWQGGRDASAAQAALNAGIAALGVEGWRLLAKDRLDHARIDSALAALDRAVPALKALFVEACVAVARADGTVTPAEWEAVRAIAAALGCAVPLAVARDAGARAAC